MSLDCQAMDQYETYGEEREPMAQVPETADCDQQLISASDWEERKRLAKPAMLRRKIPWLVCFLGLGLLVIYKIDVSGGWYGLLIIPHVFIGLYIFSRLAMPVCHRFNLLCPNCKAAFYLDGVCLEGFSFGNLEQGGQCPKCKLNILESDKHPLNFKKVFTVVIVGSFFGGLIGYPIGRVIGHAIGPGIKSLSQWLPFLQDKAIAKALLYVFTIAVFCLGIVLFQRTSIYKKYANWIRK